MSTKSVKDEVIVEDPPEVPADFYEADAPDKASETEQQPEVKPAPRGRRAYKRVDHYPMKDPIWKWGGGHIPFMVKRMQARFIVDGEEGSPGDLLVHFRQPKFGVSAPALLVRQAEAPLDLWRPDSSWGNYQSASERLERPGPHTFGARLAISIARHPGDSPPFKMTNVRRENQPKPGDITLKSGDYVIEVDVDIPNLSGQYAVDAENLAEDLQQIFDRLNVHAATWPTSLVARPINDKGVQPLER